MSGATGNSLEDVIATLRRILQLQAQTPLAADTKLLGGVPEFDSLAVASVVIGLEEQFGLSFDDDDITADLFETVGTLAAFVDRARRPHPEAGPQPYFLTARSGRLYAIRRDGPPGSRCVVFVPPFAEEMNRVRPIITAAGAALNAAGLSCCYFDLHGTGDSDGDFGDARWELWLGDLHDVVAHVLEQGASGVDLIGIRLGARLAVDFIDRRPSAIGRAVFWDPVLDGAAYADRFLRTRTMAAMMTGDSESVASLRERLAAGETIEVGGYALHPELAGELDALDATLRNPGKTAMHWLCREQDDRLEAYAGSMGIAPASVRITAHAAYWASVERTAAPALVEASRQCLGATGT